MIQLNLLPAVKEEYIKTQRLKRLIFGASFTAALGALVITVILASVVYGTQKLTLNNLDKSITQNTKELNNTPDLEKILTIQNQLNSLTALHDKKPVTSRIFEFLPQVTPNDVSISKLNLNLDGDPTLTISGLASTLESANRFVDTLKFTKFTVNDSTSEQSAFSEVVLTSFSRTSNGTEFSITLKYDANLFSSTNATVKLIVPKQITTRSTTEQPTNLFKDIQIKAQ